MECPNCHGQGSQTKESPLPESLTGFDLAAGVIAVGLVIVGVISGYIKLWNVVFLALTAFYAYCKGFNPWVWLFTAGPLGLIVLFFVPSAAEKGIADQIRLERRRTGNIVGASVSGLLFIVVSLFIVAAQTAGR